MAKSLKHLFHMLFKHKSANCYAVLLFVQMWNVWSQLGTYVPLSWECTFLCGNIKCAFLIRMCTFPYGCMIIGNLVGKWTNNNPNVSPWSPHFQWEHQKFPIWECPMCELVFPQFPTMGTCSYVGIHILKSVNMFCKCHTCAMPFHTYTDVIIVMSCHKCGPKCKMENIGPKMY
jgi:hypothetical protein